MLKIDSEPVLVLKMLRPRSREDQILEYVSGIGPQYVPRIRFLHQTEDGVIMAQAAVGPVKLESGKTVHTLRDMLQPQVFAKVSRAEIRAFFSQVITFLSQMQEADPAFVHNDLKCDNILLTPSDDAPFQIIVIDFETVATSKFGLSEFDADDQTLVDFGLGLGYSAYTDLHLVFLEVWHKLNALATKQDWAYDFVVFTLAIFPLHFMQTWAEKGKYVTRFNRLNANGRSALDQLREREKILSLRSALQHPFLTKE